MYNAYGSHVFKKYQVNMGNPYKVKLPQSEKRVKDIFDEEACDLDEEKISQDIIEEAKLEAERIINEAQTNANIIMEEAQEKISMHMLQVEQVAKEEGYRNGERLAQMHYHELIEEVEKTKEQITNEYQQTMEGLETEIVQMILDIAKKVIGDELTSNPETILNIVRKTMKSSSHTDNLIVRVSDDDFDFITDNKIELLQDGKDIHDISIKKDASLKKGDCIVETEYGTSDGSAKLQMDAIEEAFLEMLGNSDPFLDALDTEE